MVPKLSAVDEMLQSVFKSDIIVDLHQNSMKTICVSHSLRGVYSFSDYSYGICICVLFGNNVTLVGLHRMEDSKCIVAGHSDVDLKRVAPGLRQVPDDLILAILMHLSKLNLKTAISAFQQLCHEELKGRNIIKGRSILTRKLCTVKSSNLLDLRHV